MHKEINKLLEKLLLDIKFILTDTFIGMYIGGSLANNCFVSQTSDIDCYIITRNNLSKDKLYAIESMHKELYSSNIPYAQKLEVSYIPQNDLLNLNPQSVRPYFNEGEFNLAHYGCNFFIELFVLRKKGIIIAGPNIEQLTKEITEDQLQNAIQNNLHEYWENMLNNTLKFSRSDYQVFAILTMCRTLYSLETGDITTKSKAAQWAINKLDGNWKNLVEQAIAWKPDYTFNKLEETRQFVKYVIDKSRDYKD